MLSNLPTNASTVTAQRLTAQSALSRADMGDAMSFGGRTFEDGSCINEGTDVLESVEVSGGEATFVVFESEALVVSF